MKIKPKKFVYFVERKPHWLSNRQGYFTMERNERVDDKFKAHAIQVKSILENSGFSMQSKSQSKLINKENKI